jgi:signal transduction histidine kinase
MAVLRAIEGINTGQLIPVEGQSGVRGRHPDCDVVLDSSAVSRQHARLVVDRGTYYVEDLGSRNGTFVNGTAVSEPTVLELGDRLRLGPDVVLAVAVEDSVEEVLLRRQRLETLGRLTAGVVHDLNNMLGAIKSSAELLETMAAQQWTAEDRDENVRDILTAADRAAGLSAQLLLLAKGEPKHEPVPLRRVCKDAAAIARRTFAGNVQLDVVVRSDAYVNGNHTQLLQAVLNLLVNARDAVAAAGRRSIALRLTEREGKARIEVEDEGHGIDEPSLEKIFEPFYSGSGASFGVGLSTVRDIVVRHGGEVAVETTPGVGTLFALLLPSMPRVEGEEHQTPPRLESFADITGRRILLVDDEPTVRRSIQRVLRSHGAEVETASSAERALARLRDGERDGFDLLVLDCDLPGMSGTSLLVRIRSDGLDVPVIGVSGHQDGNEMREAGAASFLVKPFANVTLIAACQEALVLAR